MPAIVYLKLFQIGTAFDSENHSIFHFAGFCISETGDNFVNPDIKTAPIRHTQFIYGNHPLFQTILLL